AAVGEFVAVDGGDDDVFEFHEGGGLGDAAGFVEVEDGGAAGGDVAEAAGAGADVAEDHEGGGAAAPAFAHVGAFGGLAGGMGLERVPTGRRKKWRFWGGNGEGCQESQLFCVFSFWWSRGAGGWGVFEARCGGFALVDRIGVGRRGGMIWDPP